MKLSHLAYAAAMAAAGVLVASDANAQVRANVSVTGSSTVFPYSQAAAEFFQQSTNFTVQVTSIGTGAGFQAFCGGVGTQHADITGASRRMTLSEFQLCVTNGVTNITEIQLGFDGLSLAQSVTATPLSVTLAQIYQALAAQIPNAQGQLIANPNTNWSQIDPSLPGRPIRAYGPPPTSGTRDAFHELAMLPGCQSFAASIGVAAPSTADCTRMRTDGPFIEAGENDIVIVNDLTRDAQAIGIFGYSFLYENLDRITGIPVDGVTPSLETIADASYPVTRPLFFYIKNQHRGIVQGLNAFVVAYTAEEAMGIGGYLTERGLVPLSDARRATMRDRAAAGTHMTQTNRIEAN